MKIVHALQDLVDNKERLCVVVRYQIGAKYRHFLHSDSDMRLYDVERMFAFKNGQNRRNVAKL